MTETTEQLPKLRKPARDEAILQARAEGRALADIAQAAGCSERTVSRVAADNQSWLEEQLWKWRRKVLSCFGDPVAARLADAADQESRTGPASFRELRELLGWGLQRGGAQIHLGDVNIGSVHLSDERRQLILANATDPERYAELRDRLGLAD